VRPGEIVRLVDRDPSSGWGDEPSAEKLVMRHNATPEGKSVRLLRVGEQVRHILADVLMRGDVHDEVLAAHQVSVTEVRMSPDLKHATVFVKPLLGADEDKVLKALRTNTAFFQSEVARRVNLKYAAKLKFLADESFDEGDHIDALLRSPRIIRDLKDPE
jgi:ribosome-binding factor A